MTDSKELSLREYFKSDEVVDLFTQALGSQRAAPSYISSVLIAVRNDDRLMACTKTSILSAALRAATLGLTVDQSIGHAYLVPYNTKHGMICNFQPGYKGIYQLALRTGAYTIINVSPIYEGATWEEDPITGVLTIDRSHETSKTPIAWIGYFKMSQKFGGLEKYIIMTVEEIHQHKEQYSKAWERKDSAWQTNTRIMEKKTVLLRLLTHWGYLDPAHQAALSEENEDLEEYDYIEVDYVPEERSLQSNLDAITGGGYQEKAREASGSIERDHGVEIKATSEPASKRVRVKVEDLDYYKVVRSMAWAGKVAAHNPVDRPDVYYQAYAEDVLGYTKQQANEILEAHDLKYDLAFLRCYLNEHPVDRIPEHLFKQDGE